MEMQFCLSCAIPLSPDHQGKNPQFCTHCTDENGELRSREHILEGIVQFLKMLQPQIDNSTAFKRAEYYLKAMPAWADQ